MQQDNNTRRIKTINTNHKISLYADDVLFYLQEQQTFYKKLSISFTHALTIIWC